MKNLFFASLFAVMTVAAFTSCSKDQMSRLDGTYTGIFTSEYGVGTTVVRELTLTLQNGEFTVVDSTEDGHPSANGSGYWNMTRGRLIFSDQQGRNALHSWD